MKTPYEDLEYLAEFLPDEGESMMVTRQNGELQCEPFRPAPVWDGLDDQDLHGRLVHANSRLSAIGCTSICVIALGVYWACVVFHQLSHLGWSAWYIDLGFVLTGYFAWSLSHDYRRKLLFLLEVRPMLEAQIRDKRLQKYSLISIIQRHPELNELHEMLHHWSD